VVLPDLIHLPALSFHAFRHYRLPSQSVVFPLQSRECRRIYRIELTAPVVFRDFLIDFGFFRGLLVSILVCDGCDGVGIGICMGSGRAFSGWSSPPIALPDTLSDSIPFSPNFHRCAVSLVSNRFFVLLCDLLELSARICFHGLSFRISKVGCAVQSELQNCRGGGSDWKGVSSTFCEVNRLAFLSDLRGILSRGGGSRSLSQSGSWSVSGLDFQSGSGIDHEEIDRSDRLETESTKQRISNEVFERRNLIREVIFNSPSECREINGFRDFVLLFRIVIPQSVEIIDWHGFRGCISLAEVLFGANSHLREIDGFSGCISLCRITFPSSLESIRSNGFNGCTLLTEVIFESGSHLTSLAGFCGCTSLSRIELPPSLQYVYFAAFTACESLRVVEFPLGSRLCDRLGMDYLKVFIHYGNDHLKAKRREIEIGMVLRTRKDSLSDGLEVGVSFVARDSNG
jgi:hypothetical protein